MIFVHPECPSVFLSGKTIAYYFNRKICILGSLKHYSIEKEIDIKLKYSR